MDTPLTSFKALVKFEFDRLGLGTEIAKVRKQLQGLAGTEERATKKKQQQAAKAHMSEWRMLLLQARALRENAKIDAKRAADAARNEQRRYNEWWRQRAAEDAGAAMRAKQAAKAERDQRAAELRRLRAQGVAGKEAAKQARERQQAADREYNQMLRNAYQENRDFNIRRNRQRQAQREQDRIHQQNIRRYGGGGSGGSDNPNPWHIAGGSGMLAGNNVRAFGATIGAGAGIKQLYDVANFQIAQEPQFEFLTGSAEEAKKQISFLNKEVDRLGLNLMDTSVQYRQLLASTGKNLGIEKTQELFSSFQNIGAMLGLTTDAQNRGLRAFAQMASKGQVYSEELDSRLAA